MRIFLQLLKSFSMMLYSAFDSEMLSDVVLFIEMKALQIIANCNCKKKCRKQYKMIAKKLD